MQLTQLFKKLKGNQLFSNSFWGGVSNLFQNLLLSFFFIILARVYSTQDFGHYIISNTLYSFVLGFSSLGLSHWFIREVINKKEQRQDIINKFFKIQLVIGFLFYIINLIIAYSLYESSLVRQLSMIIGINIIFDNVINAIKALNIADLQQKKTFILLVTEAFLKFLIACLLIFYKIDIFILSLILITLRLITLNLFINIGSSNEISLGKLIRVKVDWKEIRTIIFGNWAFIVISSLSIVNWRIGSIIVSKVLTLKDLADYEISFKLLSIAYLLPIIVSSSVYPTLINAFKEGREKMKNIYNKAFFLMMAYGLLAFTFTFSFVDIFIPLLFGPQYANTSVYCIQMFWVMLVFPTIFLQANVILTLKLEKIDMLCNITSVLINITLCFAGFAFSRSLSIVNFAIFTSFLLFHLIQDFILIKQKVTIGKHVLMFYVVSALITVLFYSCSTIIDKKLIFALFWFVILIIALFNKSRILAYYSQTAEIHAEA
jgi:O-antigen/teichoic acid export membrane protein